MAIKLLNIDLEKTIQCFYGYMQAMNLRVSRAEFEANLSKKLKDANFLEDIFPLLSQDSKVSIFEDAKHVHTSLIAKLQGEPYSLLPQMVAEFEN